MANIPVPALNPSQIGKLVDTSELTSAGNVVERQNIVISDPNTAAAVAPVSNATPSGSEYALLTRTVGGSENVTGFLLEAILLELRAIRFGIQILNAGQVSYDDLDPLTGNLNSGPNLN